MSTDHLNIRTKDQKKSEKSKNATKLFIKSANSY